MPHPAKTTIDAPLVSLLSATSVSTLEKGGGRDGRPAARHLFPLSNDPLLLLHLFLVGGGSKYIENSNCFTTLFFSFKDCPYLGGSSTGLPVFFFEGAFLRLFSLSLVFCAPSHYQISGSPSALPSFQPRDELVAVGVGLLGWWESPPSAHPSNERPKRWAEQP